MRFLLSLQLLLLIESFAARADSNDIYTLQAGKFTPGSEHASRFGKLHVQSPSRKIMQVDMYTSDLLMEIYEDRSFMEFSSTQVILGWILFPDFWNKVPLFYQNDTELNHLVKASGTYIRLSDVVDFGGNYKLADKVKEVRAKPVSELSSLDKQILKLDDKVQLYLCLQRGERLPLFPLPADVKGRWYSPGDDLSVFSGKDSLLVSHIFPWYLNEVITAIDSGRWEKSNEVLDMMLTFQQAQSTQHLSVQEPPEKSSGISSLYCLIIGVILGSLTVLWLGTRKKRR